MHQDDPGRFKMNSTAGEMDYIIDNKIKSDIETVGRFIDIYCTHNHESKEKKEINASGVVGEYIKNMHLMVCSDCKKLLLHSSGKRISCPYDPKPSCKKCETHCYGKGYRKKIKEVMKFSGIHLIKMGNLRLIKKYFF